MEQRTISRTSAAFLIGCIALVLWFMVMGVSHADAPFGHTSVESTEDCAEFLYDLGWETDAAAAHVQNTVLPKTFDNVFTQYNALQLTQGADLTRYAGKSVTVYTLPVTNYTGVSGTVYATVLVHDGQVIGGDLHSAELGGFMHALK